ncbi:MAG TPA: FAD-dependent oxidoreductase [Vicinamibacteria bacterium]|nr:FAD-dependent oxidoreductase [Vicinamibacteria bacterium]
MRRRDFLAGTAWTAAALPFVDPLRAVGDVQALERRGPSRRVIVVGAGLAGLCAAYQLTRAGHDVLVLEAQRRAGGRVQTLRDFAEDLRAEAGATRIPDHHHFTLRYVKAFGLELDPFRPPGATVFHVHGQRLAVQPGERPDWPLELTPGERALGLDGVQEKAYGGLLARIGDAASSSWVPPEDLRQYDRMTFTELLRERGLSEAAIHLRRAATGAWDDTVRGEGDSALRRLRTLALDSAGATYHTIRGGNDLLPRAFALRLADRIRYGCPVVRIERGRDTALRVVWSEADGPQSSSADRVVAAVPFTLLRRIEVVPPFSDQKARAVAELSYGSSTKVFLQTRTRFWTQDGLSGFGCTDLHEFMQVWELGHSQPGPRGLLVAYSKFSGAREFDALDEESRLVTAVDAVSKVHPDLPRHCEGGLSKSWDQDPWARGAFAILRPGDVTRLEPHIARPEGNVHFAGEHTSPLLGGWMHSALESGERVAREINEAG